MQIESLATALEQEHRTIDAGIAAFTAEPVAGERDARPLTEAMRALRRHIYLEEEFLFPPLREAGLFAPILVMLREHAQIWAILDELQLDLRLGASEADELAACRQLSVQLLHHNLKEEKIVYPEVDKTLSGAVAAEFQQFLDSEEMPEGWICERARAS